MQKIQGILRRKQLYFRQQKQRKRRLRIIIISARLRAILHKQRAFTVSADLDIARNASFAQQLFRCRIGIRPHCRFQLCSLLYQNSIQLLNGILLRFADTLLHPACIQTDINVIHLIPKHYCHLFHQLPRNSDMLHFSKQRMISAIICVFLFFLAKYTHAFLLSLTVFFIAVLCHVRLPFLL